MPRAGLVLNFVAAPWTDAKQLQVAHKYTHTKR